MNKETGQESDGQDKERKGRGAAEIVVATVSAGIVLFLVGYAIYHAITASGMLPRLTAVALISQVTEQDGKYVLPVEIRNETRPTVQDVRVVVRPLGTNADQTQAKEIIIRYLPENSQVKGYAILESKPQGARIQVQIQSYRMP